MSIVTYNSARYIRRCLEAVLEQRGIKLDVVVVENASFDGTLQILQDFGERIRILRQEVNRGFAEAQNIAIRFSRAEWVLTLNPDVLLQPDFISTLVAAGEAHPKAGTICGKLLAIGPDFERLPERLVDSTGIFFTPAMRHFDRGGREPDQASFDRPEYVFGASAAAALFRRSMIEDVAVEGCFFDPDFFAYREDADVAWRAQLLGWKCLYTPAATAYHVRTLIPGNRRAVPAAINMHSVKNRFLMRIKNATGGLYRRFWLPMTARDLVVLAGMLFWEPRSLPALWHAAKCVPAALRKRRQIMRRKRVDDEVLAQWFSFAPAAQPLTTVAPQVRAAAVMGSPELVEMNDVA